MKPAYRAIFAAVLALSALALPALAQAQMIGIYRNDLSSLAQRSQLVKLAGRSCARTGAKGVVRVTVGKKTEACAYRTPVVGRDLEIVATERLLSGTPAALQRKAYLGLELRAGGGAKYQLLAFPLQQKLQLVKVTPERTKYLAIVKGEPAVKGVNKANALRLRAVNVTSGPEQGDAKLEAFLGSKKVAEATDESAGDLQGRASAIVVGAPGNANGLIASLDDIVIRLPSPF
ncbi:MAG TPA: hypothetical protein VMT37_07620 [Solirubrobacterales bacterium]|nr:hypothetical protein [Solirubrobacterales bacterium]